MLNALIFMATDARFVHQANILTALKETSSVANFFGIMWQVQGANPCPRMSYLVLKGNFTHWGARWHENKIL